MSLRWRRMARASSVLVAVALAAACSHAAPAKRIRPLVGVTLLTETHMFYKAMEDALRAEAATKNMDLVIVSCEMDPAKQASQFEDFVTQKVDAILAAPCDSNAVVSYVQAATAAGIPVFTADIAA